MPIARSIGLNSFAKPFSNTVRPFSLVIRSAASSAVSTKSIGPSKGALEVSVGRSWRDNSSFVGTAPEGLLFFEAASCSACASSSGFMSGSCKAASALVCAAFPVNLGFVDIFITSAS